MMFGAIFASGIALFFEVPGFIRVPVALISVSNVGGMLWALLVGSIENAAWVCMRFLAVWH